MVNSIKKNFIYNAFYQILALITPLVTTPYISRILRPEGIGMYSYGYSVAYYFVMFIMLGLNNYGNRTIASVRDNRFLLSKSFSNIYVTQFCLGILLIFMYMIYCFSLAEEKTVSLILSLYVISGMFDVNWFFYGMEEFNVTVTRNVAVKILTVLAIFWLVRDSGDVYKYCFIMAAGFLISQICVWPFLLNRIDFVKPKWSEARKHIKPNLVLFTTTLAVSLFKIMDKIMLGIMTNSAQVGFYESSEKVINIPIAFVTALGTVMLPRMTNLISNGKEKDSSFISLSLLFAMVLTCSLCLGIMSISDIFVPLFYGKGYTECTSLFMILLPSCIFLAFANVIRTQYLLPHKMDRIYVTSAFIGATVNIFINILLIRHFAAKGAAIGTLFAEAAVCIYQCFKIRKKIPVGKYVIQTLPAVIAGIGMLFVVRSVKFIGNEIGALICKVIIGAIIYIVLFLFLCIPKWNEYKKMFEEIKNA